MIKTERQHHQRVYELDLLRSLTALCVITTHVLFFTTVLNHSELGTQMQHAIVTSFHFAREVFMFVTAFALVYVYYGKPFSFKRFWTKRGIGVLLPYCMWSALYVWVQAPNQPLGQYIGTTIVDLLTGNASYQLYYILLSLQFYAILPLLLLFLRRTERHPWTVLVASFVIQVLLLSIDYYYIQKGLLAPAGIWQTLAQYRDRFVFTCQLYFILGAMAALHMQQVRAFLLRHEKLVVGGSIAALGALWGHYFLQIRVYHESIAYASTVLQPIMTVYCPAVIAFFFWLSIRWASQREQEGAPTGYPFWRMLSNASFGTYLVHPLILAGVLQWVVPTLSHVFPAALSILFVWSLTASGAAMVSVILLHIPVASRLVGRAHASLPNSALRGWFSNQSGSARATKRLQRSGEP